MSWSFPRSISDVRGGLDSEVVGDGLKVMARWSRAGRRSSVAGVVGGLVRSRQTSRAMARLRQRRASLVPLPSLVRFWM